MLIDRGIRAKAIKSKGIYISGISFTFLSLFTLLLNQSASIIFHRYISDNTELKRIKKQSQIPTEAYAALTKYNFEIKPAVKGNPAKLSPQIIKEKKVIGICLPIPEREYIVILF